MILLGPLFYTLPVSLLYARTSQYITYLYCPITVPAKGSEQGSTWSSTLSIFGESEAYQRMSIHTYIPTYLYINRGCTALVLAVLQDEAIKIITCAFLLTYCFFFTFLFSDSRFPHFHLISLLSVLRYLHHAYLPQVIPSYWPPTVQYRIRSRLQPLTYLYQSEKYSKSCSWLFN